MRHVFTISALLLAASIVNLFAHVGKADAKVGLSYISAKERKELFKLVDQYARAEAVMMVCSKSTRLESRVFRAARPCVTKKALGRIRWYYRKRLSSHKTAVVKEACTLPSVKKAVPRIRSAVSKLVAQIHKTCSMCFFC